MADQLAIWGVRTDARMTRIDFGSVPRRSSGDEVFRVRNQSTQYLARGVRANVEAVTPFADTQFLLSLDGASFTAAVDLGDLPPGAISPVITLRRVTPSTTPAGDHKARLHVVATTWVQPSNA